MYVATSYAKPGFPAQVIVDSSESMSIDTMAAMTKSGNKCARFVTDVDAYVAYSEGKEMTTKVVAGENGKNTKLTAVVVNP
jgi:hypothetical protein